MKKIDILLVEDHILSQDLIRLFFERYGFSVVTAENAQEALNLARIHFFSCVFSDIGLPDESGFDLIETLQTFPHLAETKFLLLTGQLNVDIEERIKSTHYVVLEKPVTTFTKVGDIFLFDYLKKKLRKQD